MIIPDSMKNLRGAIFPHDAKLESEVYGALPGYPWLPCPICRGIEGCDHSVPERARTVHPCLSLPTATKN